MAVHRLKQSPHLDATGDIFMPIGGLDPAVIANIVKAQLLNRGYLKEDGTVIVDMDKLLGAPDQERK